MNQLFNDNRLAAVLQFYRKNPNTSVSILASKLNVSDRTIRNDIKELNQELENSAVIEGKQGKYSLRILQPDKFMEKYSALVQETDFLNSSSNRMDYIFGRLMRSEVPLLTDELAYEMNIGRTTFMNDLKKLRAKLEPYHLMIKGMTSKGLLLSGTEMDIRNYILEQNYEEIYKQYPLDPELYEALNETFKEHPFEKNVRESLRKFATLMLDRFLTGHYIGQLQDKYYNMTARPEFKIIDRLVNHFGEILHVDFPVEEKLFLFLPIIGMRTPADLQNMHSIELDQSICILADRIFEQIHLQMNILLDTGEYTEEFLYHVMFMINRLRFQVRLKNPMLEEIKDKYPLAYEMTDIAAKVIWDEYGLTVSEAERGYLAAYFGIFLTEHNLKMKKTFRIAVVCGTGRVTARLILIQLKKIVDSSAEISLFADEKITTDLLDQFDIILTTMELSCKTIRPVIQIHEVFNERELLYKMEKAKYWNQIEIPVLDNNWFVMTGLLDEKRFFLIDEGSEYKEALKIMAEGLYDNGDVDEGFYDRLLEREQKGMTAFDHSVAIPHVIHYEGNKLILAVGVCAKPLVYHDREVSVIFMIGLPNQVDADDNILIRVYDEIITISQDEELLQKICNADSFSTLLRVLYRQAGE